VAIYPARKNLLKRAMEWLAPVMIVLATIVAMEGVAWAGHKYVMHGFAWGWHRDHHEPHGNKLEKNDLFALVGAAFSIALFALGAEAWWPGTWLGLGMLGYGIAYILVHDGLIHLRWFRWAPTGGYAKRLIQAHRLHHAAIGRRGGVGFGFLLARDPAVLRRALAAQARAGMVELRHRRYKPSCDCSLRSYAVARGEHG
jgi:beta-carotene 3-hydroxylase